MHASGVPDCSWPNEQGLEDQTATDHPSHGAIGDTPQRVSRPQDFRLIMIFPGLDPSITTVAFLLHLMSLTFYTTALQRA